MASSKIDILIYWEQVPYYAVQCINSLFTEHILSIFLIGTNSNVPYQGLDKVLKVPHKIHKNIFLSYCRQLAVQCPHVVAISGWINKKIFLVSSLYCFIFRKKLVIMIDTPYSESKTKKLTFKLLRLVCKYFVHGALCSGVSSEKLALSLGISPSYIRKGLYAADENIFFSDKKYFERGKTILSVGQLIDRKNHQLVIDAFIQSKLEKEGWKLVIIGSGSQEYDLGSSDAVEIMNFVQPEMLALYFRQSRIFVLASKQENWGVVVHEAALSGCLILLSASVHSKYDFSIDDDKFIFEPSDLIKLKNLLKMSANLDIEEADVIQDQMIKIAKRFSPTVFAKSFIDIIS